MKKTIYHYFVIIIAIACQSSCISKKQIAYFQKAPGGLDTIAVSKLYIPKVQAGDILDIKIGSLNPKASSFFNPFSSLSVTPDNPTSPNTAATGASNSPALSQSAAPGYLVDATGIIEYPILGTVKVAGLTTAEVRDTIKTRLKLYLKEPSVTVRFLNYKISVMGEVLHPSVYVIPNETVTLPEALSLAGDMTIYGRRDNVLVIRDVNGKKELGYVNLNNRDLFNSPYYYLHANDVVYVEPGKGRIAQTDKTYQLLPIILSALSLLSIIIVYSKK